MNLNAAHLHIMLNHVPVFGSLFAALLIAWGLLRKSEDVLRLGLALAFVVGIAAAGVAGLFALLLVRRRHRAARGLSILTLVVSLVGFAAVSRAALLGGEIRHPEARPDFVVPAESGA